MPKSRPDRKSEAEILALVRAAQRDPLSGEDDDEAMPEDLDGYLRSVLWTNFQTVLVALYGANYKTAAAADLRVNPSTLHRWMTKETSIPRRAWDDLALVSRSRIRLLTQMLEGMEHEGLISNGEPRR